MIRGLMYSSGVREFHLVRHESFLNWQQCHAKASSGWWNSLMLAFCHFRQESRKSARYGAFGGKGRDYQPLTLETMRKTDGDSWVLSHPPCESRLETSPNLYGRTNLRAHQEGSPEGISFSAQRLSPMEFQFFDSPKEPCCAPVSYPTYRKDLKI